MESVLKERRELLEATHLADVNRLKSEHEKNLKNLEQELQDKVYVVLVFSHASFSYEYTCYTRHLIYFAKII